MKTTLGGDRVGSGNKQEINLKNYGRSTHDMGYIFRSTMASGTLVPFINEIALPGDSFDIDLDTHVLTHPTIGPLFGSYKVQLDVYQVPMRLYNSMLHMNMLKIGLDMSAVKIPKIKIEAEDIFQGDNPDNKQINPSSIYAYLGIRGLGNNDLMGSQISNVITRKFNAMPLLAYWDIYKNYYANKQEEIGVVIHNNLIAIEAVVSDVTWVDSNGVQHAITQVPMATNALVAVQSENTNLQFEFTNCFEEFDIDRLIIQVTRLAENVDLKVSEIYENWLWNINTVTGDATLQGTVLKRNYPLNLATISCNGWAINTDIIGNLPPKLLKFDLENIDTMRTRILQAPQGVEFVIERGALNDLPPYTSGLELLEFPQGRFINAGSSGQEGLGIKTYQSDLFNNWLNKEWLDGDNGVNQITALSTLSGEITIDEINLQTKIYNMLNRINASGGSYDDWLDAVYSHERPKSIENPVYMGGLSRELVFDEVISNAASEDQPLGTLAGRGNLNGKKKGGRVKINVNEPSLILGIVSLTPRLDYSQGNKWSVDLDTINDLHKPALDGIGFQNLMTDNMAYFETTSTDGVITSNVVGKQPAWINYMTNVNQVYGNFADRNQQMYMVLNRRYEMGFNGTQPYIKDLTTYIDPSKFNHIFADTRLDAQNFWMQIKVDMIARRKMSAKIIPNL